MEVEIISKEYIKPSSPTPPNLKTHKLSFLDQFIPTAYVPIILFYPMNQSTGHSVADIVSQRSQLLKQSLSETLTHFYPFAGKVKDTISIDCNDEGVYYVEARVNCHLLECLNQPNTALFYQFLRGEALGKELTAGDHVAMIQASTFACGGIAIGVLVSHMIADGTGMSVFLKGWATTAHKAREAVLCPNFDAPSVFIQNDAHSREESNTYTALFNPFFKSGRFISRRVVFDASAIASLKAKATSPRVQNPTRVEVVSALLWKCMMAAFKATSGIHMPTFIIHPVNFRRRAIPPFAESFMGNLIWSALASCTGEEIELPDMVCKLREAITKIDGDFVKSLQGDGGFAKHRELVKEMVGACASAASSSGMNYITFTSWCNFGLYDIDFGWGKPIWVSLVGSNGNSEAVLPSLVLLMDTRSGDGIEAWVMLDKEDMIVLGQDKELLAFASLDTSPIN
ncbi:stemmadenine O-acetyltransferase-like [Alnus glutinosa]|uniref:stemmadenine O-acetyltransferase-like n=1 Tax=Alnus glutinosa TaxID=3517 RepID=UPI002D77B119|nr:stemmadenine O-acetyltransferase-like [Alnus glutinosa]